MLSRANLCAIAGRRAVSLATSRHIAISAACCQKAPAASATDPIQKLFIDKIHEYAQKSKAAGGKLVDASPSTEKALKDEMEKIARVYGAKGADFTKFPTFNFTDPDLEPVGVNVDIKAVEQEVIAAEEEDDDRPYWQV
jgi:F-type H+-transporting ATPase subunit 6